MTEHCHSDAAYVLGALSPADRRAFEDHLRDCARCQASVQRLAGMPGLLALMSEADIEDTGPPVPDSLLPGLAARIGVERRRRSRLIGGALAASIAALLALVGILVLRAAPTDTAATDTAATDTAATHTAATDTAAGSASGGGSATTSTAPPVAARPMTQVVPGPMSASLELVDKKWGTAITVICQYEQYVDPSEAYDLAVIDTDGNLNEAGTWRAVPGVTARVATATAVPRDRIAALEVRLPDGKTILTSAP